MILFIYYSMTAFFAVALCCWLTGHNTSRLKTVFCSSTALSVFVYLLSVFVLFVIAAWTQSFELAFAELHPIFLDHFSKLLGWFWILILISSFFINNLSQLCYLQSVFQHTSSKTKYWILLNGGWSPVESYFICIANLTVISIPWVSFSYWFFTYFTVSLISRYIMIS